MGNHFFNFKQFSVNQQNASMKVGVDAVLLGAWAKSQTAKNILDIGTGTGLLALMMAQKSLAKITAIEIDEIAYKQAVENINNSGWSERIQLINVSLQKFVLLSKHKFDFIICNPPYFNSSLVSPIKTRTLARHDQSLNLSELLKAVCNLLDVDGRLVLIYPHSRQNELLIKSRELGFFTTHLLEISGNERKSPNRVIIEFSRKESNFSKSKLVVRDSVTNDYTADYKELTKDFYLNF
jgi:tRNA1Val (adenine37-N6)-methyltransferase